MIDTRIRRLVNLLTAYYAPDQIILFGSHAKGTVNADSDIDLLLIRSSSLPRSQRGVELAGLLSEFDVKIDLLFYTPDEIADAQKQPRSFVNSILQQGVTVYSKPD